MLFGVHATWPSAAAEWDLVPTVSEMAQQVKILTAKPDSLTLNLGAHVVGKKDYCKLSSDPDLCIMTYTPDIHKEINKQLQKAAAMVTV